MLQDDDNSTSQASPQTNYERAEEFQRLLAQDYVRFRAEHNGYEVQNALGHDAFKNPFQEEPEHILKYPDLCRYLEAFFESRARYFQGGSTSVWEDILESLFQTSKSKLDLIILRRQEYFIQSLLDPTLYLGVVMNNHNSDEYPLCTVTAPQGWKRRKGGCLLHTTTGMIMGTSSSSCTSSSSSSSSSSSPETQPTKGTRVVIRKAERDGHTGLKWKIPWQDKNKEGEIALASSLDLVLDVDMGSTAPGTPVILWQKKKLRKRANQKWKLVPRHTCTTTTTTDTQRCT